MPFHLSDEWKHTMFRLLKAGGQVLVSGPPDSGKSTFCLALANACATRGHRCAVLDADLGQSEIGPPGTLGLAHLDEPVTSFAEIATDEIYFVGSTSPFAHLLQCVSGVARLCSRAACLDPYLTIIDMPGFVTGPVAASFVNHTISVAEVDFVVVLRQGGGMDFIDAALRGLKKPEILVVPPASAALRRSQNVRSARRRLKFAKYFLNAETHQIDGRACGLPGGGVFMAEPLQRNEMSRLAKVLGCQVVYAEKVDTHTLVITRSVVGTPEQMSLPADFDSGKSTCIRENWFSNILVGLAADDGRHHAAGIINRVDFSSERYHIITPFKRIEIVTQLLLGSMRIAPDGRELGRVQMKELFGASKIGWG